MTSLKKLGYSDEMNNKGLETLGGTTIPVRRPHFIVNPLSKHARFAPRIFCRAAGPELEGRMGPHTMGPAHLASPHALVADDHQPRQAAADRWVSLPGSAATALTRRAAGGWPNCRADPLLKRMKWIFEPYCAA